jgi:hypothetical protein
MILDLPAEILNILALFSPLFSQPVYKNAVQLFLGHILCKDRRTIADILRCLHLKNLKNFSKFHWVLSGAKWSALQAAKILFITLVKLVPLDRDIILVFDSTLERRKGPKIQSLGRQRDAVRSSKDKKVLTIGLNWLVCALNIQIPFTKGFWALPFLSILMPPKRPLSSSKNQRDLHKKRRYKTIPAWSCQVIHLLYRWVRSTRKITIVADSAFACFDILYACLRRKINLISRLRLDARLYDFVPETITEKRGRKRVVGNVLPKLSELAKKGIAEWQEIAVRWYGGTSKTVRIQSGKCLWYYIGFRPVPINWVLIFDASYKTPVALFSTDMTHSPEQIIESYVRRWSLEVTFEESRRHLGVETQRQWSDKAIERTTPLILASFSIITIMGLNLSRSREEFFSIQKSRWYKKNHLSFSDVLAYVKDPIVRAKLKSLLGKNTEQRKIGLEKLIEEIAAA